MLTVVSFAASLLFSFPSAADVGTSLKDTGTAAQGKILYTERCADCHDNPFFHAPTAAAIRTLDPNLLVKILTLGSMREQVTGLSAAEIQAISVYLTGRGAERVPQILPPNSCKGSAGEFHFTESQWNGWGGDLQNTRYQGVATFTVAQVPRLRLKWVFSFPGGVYAQPTIAGGRLYAAAKTGRVYSLNSSTGCIYWFYDAARPIRTAISIGALPHFRPATYAAFFGDEGGKVYALDAANGGLLWQTQIGDHNAARIVGAPTVADGRVYVVVSSIEEFTAAIPSYQCCRSLSSVVALDAATGGILWSRHPNKDTLASGDTAPARVEVFGPAGAAVWSTPTVDIKRGLIYIGTGGSARGPLERGGAIVALDLKSGVHRWVRPIGAGIGRLGSCDSAAHENCTQPLGTDLDFGSAPILATTNTGKQIIVAVAKSGIVYGLDPDRRGEILWQTPVIQGDPRTIIWGPAADHDNVYISVTSAHPLSSSSQGIFTALALQTGKQVWQAAFAKPECSLDPQACSHGQPSAVAAMPSVVFSGSLDGHLRAYSSSTGILLWDFASLKPFNAVNGGLATGGTIDRGGEIIADGALFAMAGSPTFGVDSDSALLAFTPEGE